MREMYLSEPASFDEILANLADLENRINHTHGHEYDRFWKLAKSMNTTADADDLALARGLGSSGCQVAR